MQAQESDALKSVVQRKVEPGHSRESMQILGRVHADVWGFPGSNDDIDQLEGGNGPQDRLGFRRLRFGLRGDLPANPATLTHWRDNVGVTEGSRAA